MSESMFSPMTAEQHNKRKTSIAISNNSVVNKIEKQEYEIKLEINNPLKTTTPFPPEAEDNKKN